MAVTAAWYDRFFLSALAKELNLTSDTLKCMLCTSSYSVSQTAHRYKSDVTNEITGTGYTAGGVALTTVTVTYTSGTHVIKLAADNAQWTSSTLTARYAVVYDSTPSTDATRPLISYQNFGADVSTTAGTFLIQWNASGICTITVAVEA